MMLGNHGELHIWGKKNWFCFTSDMELTMVLFYLKYGVNHVFFYLKYGVNSCCFLFASNMELTMVS